MFVRGGGEKFLPGPWMKVEDTDAITPEITQKHRNKHNPGWPPPFSSNKTNKISFFQHTWQQRFTTSFHETQLFINNLSVIKTINHEFLSNTTLLS